MFIDCYSCRINVRIVVVGLDPQRVYRELTQRLARLLEDVNGGPVSGTRDGPTADRASTSFCMTYLASGSGLTGEYQDYIFQPHLYCLTSPSAYDDDLPLFLHQTDGVVLTVTGDEPSSWAPAFRQRLQQDLVTMGCGDAPIVPWKTTDPLHRVVSSILDRLDPSTAEVEDDDDECDD